MDEGEIGMFINPMIANTMEARLTEASGLELRRLIRRTLSSSLNHEFVEEDNRHETNHRKRAAEIAKKMQMVIEKPICAKTCDGEDQDIMQTLDSVSRPATFWSSEGYARPDFAECLVYRLYGPVSIVRAVTIKVYRAIQHQGHPIYPPSFVSFAVGPNPKALAETPKLAVSPCAARQVFDLDALDCSMAGEYLVITLHGGRQKQYQDKLYYLAIESVEAWGDRCDGPAQVALLRMAMMTTNGCPRRLARFLGASRRDGDGR